MNDEVDDSREARLEEVALEQFADILRVGKLLINGVCVTWNCHGLCKEDQLKNYKHAFRERLEAPEGMTCKVSGKNIFLEPLDKRVLWFWVMKATSINFALFEVMMTLHVMLKADKDPYQVVTLETYHRKTGGNLMSYSFNIYIDRMEVTMYWKKKKDNIYLVNPMTATRTRHGFISDVRTSFPFPLEPVILPTYCVKGRARRKGRLNSKWDLAKDIVAQCCHGTYVPLDELLHIRENLSHLVHFSGNSSMLDACLKPEPICESIPEASEAGLASESPTGTIRDIVISVPLRRKQRTGSPANPSMARSISGGASGETADGRVSVLPTSGLVRRWTPIASKKPRTNIECTLPILLGELPDPKSSTSRIGDVPEPYGGMQSGGSNASNAEPRSVTRSIDMPRTQRSNRDVAPARSPGPRELTVAAYYDSLAQSGDPTGMLILGQMCYYDVFSGIRIPHRMEKAKWYFERAAMMRHPDAAYWLEKAEQVIDGRAQLEQDLSSDQGSSCTGFSAIPWLGSSRPPALRDDGRRPSLEENGLLRPCPARASPGSSR